MVLEESLCLDLASWDRPVVADSRQPSDVQHQRGVDGPRLRWFALRGGRALVTQHPGAAHPPQLRALPWFLHQQQRTS